MLAEVEGGAEGGGDGFEVFELVFADYFEHVVGPALDEGHEGAVAEGAVGAAEGDYH